MKVIYLHGMGGSPADWHLVSRLVPGAALSIPGRMSFAETVRSLRTELMSLAEPFVLCGYSLGGRLALSVAAQPGSLPLRGLVLVSSGLGFSDEQSRRERAQKDKEWVREAKENTRAFWEKWYAQELFSAFRELPEERRGSWLKNRFSLDIEDLCHQLEILSPAQQPFLLADLLRLKGSGTKLLYLAGERDKKYAALAQRLQKEGVPTEFLPGGHILPLETPERMADSLNRFMGQLET
jgi:2-succinyl-6-hydroxy-2,4-cyclohexadiene-1-carboxylate synthase